MMFRNLRTVEFVSALREEVDGGRGGIVSYNRISRAYGSLYIRVPRTVLV